MLQTNRLTLRDFVLSDFDAVHAYASDPLVTRFTSFGPNTPEETREFLNRSVHAASVSPASNLHVCGHRARQRPSHRQLRFGAV